jgi:hypothetical protein
VTDAEIEAARERSAVRHHVERLSFATEEEAAAALAEVRSGAGFAELAAQAPGDAVLDDLWVEWSAFPDALADAAAELDLGEPYLVRIGARHALIRVIERTSTEEESLEDARKRILRGLRMRKQNAELDSFSEGLRERVRPELDGDTIRLLAERTSEAILSGELTEHDTEWAIPRILAAEETLTVARWAEGARWTVRDYREALRRALPARRPHRERLEVEVRMFTDAEVAKELLYEEALRQGVGRDWWVEQAVETFRTDRHVQLAIDEIGRGAVVSQAAVDSIARILETSRPQVYRRGEMARFLRFDFDTREQALEERRRAEEAGGARKRLAEILEGDLRFRGVYHLSDISREGAVEQGLERALFGEDRGKLHGPYESQGSWSLIEGLGVHPPVALSGEEIRESIRNQLGTGESRRFVSEWIASRRQTLGITIDETVLDLLAPGA